jgi:hypothetical protein
MALRRKTIPLFDLVSKANAAASAEGSASRDGAAGASQLGAPSPAVATQAPPSRTVPLGKPIVRVELKPREVSAGEGAAPIPSPTSTPLPPALSGSQASGSNSGFGSVSIVRMPVMGVSLLAFAAIVLILGAYLLGVWYGKSAKAKEVEPLLQSKDPKVIEPAGGSLTGSVAPPGVDQDPFAARTAQGKASVAPPARPEVVATQPPANQTPPQLPDAIKAPSITADAIADPPPETPIVAENFTAIDPRSPGLNYLHLVTLPYQQAVVGVVYLRDNGVEAFAVPVDGERVAANNPLPRYMVFAGPGVTGEQLRQKQTIVTRLEAAVAKLGRAWLREFKGPSDFREPLWRKYGG